MICRNCNTSFSDNSQFCPACGAPAANEQQQAPTYGTQQFYDQNPNYSSQPTYQPSYGYGYVAPVPGKGLSITGMVLGIVSLVLCWIPFFGLFIALGGLALSICSIVMARKVGTTTGMGIAGLICSIFGSLIGFIWIIAFIASEL